MEPACRCLQCGKTIFGRKDKKFCSLGCKNAYHNHETEQRRKFMKKTDDAMHTNYMILDEALKNGGTSLSLEELAGYGFVQEIATSFKKRYRCLELGCYDIRYNQSDSRIFNIHRIGLIDAAKAKKDK